MFTGLFTGLRTARKCLSELRELREWCEQASKHIRKLQEEVQELRGSHHKLRGKVYGDRSAARSFEVEGDSREARRAAAFAKHGIMPGRAVNLEN